MELYTAILAAQPTHADANHNLGVVAMQQGRFVDSITCLRTALDASPGNGQYWLDYIEALYRAGQTDVAWKVLHDARQRGLQGPEAENLVMRLNMSAPPPAAKPSKQDMNTLLHAFSIGQYAEAVRLAKILTESFPGHAMAWNVLGAALQRLDRHAEALAALQSAVALAPEDAHMRFNLGIVFLGLRRDEEAASCLRGAIRIKPDHAEARSLLRNIERERGHLPAHLAPEHFDHANGRWLRRYWPYEADTFIYSIDVVGTCNLRCPSCPVGNFPEATRTKGIMEPELFRRIIEKIGREHAGTMPKIWLFNWGEPMLHPQLPDMIHLLRQYGMHSMISTNLNIRKNLENVIRAAPDEIKISISGFSPETYARTHARGNIALVRENMERIRNLIDRYGTATQVWISHHLYHHNRHESAEVEAFCRRLGFIHRPMPAYFQPLEKVVALLDGKQEAIAADMQANLPLPPLEMVATRRTATHPDFDCELRFNMTTLNHDGSVALCCGVYDAPNMLGVDFLATPHEEIQALKYRHSFCRTCYRHGLQYSWRPVAWNQD